MSGGGRAWRGRSYGGGLGHRLMHAFARHGGRDLCYLLLLAPALFYYLRDRSARRAVVVYWRRLDPRLGILRAHSRALGHFWSFARVLVDRVLFYVAPGSLAWSNVGAARMEEAMRHPRGCILLSAHLGNWELSGRLLDLHQHGTVNIVMLGGEDPRVREQLRRAMGDHPFAIIDLADAVGSGLAIASALTRGETCCMLGDRTAGDAANTVAVPFLGAPARFPIGPFVAAAVTGAVIVPTFCMKTGWATYRCEADEPWTVSWNSRAERRTVLEAAVTRWAERLERQVRAYPRQWHNFYDFWRL